MGQDLCLRDFIFLADRGKAQKQLKPMQKLFRDEDGFQQRQRWSSYLEAGQGGNLGWR